MRTRWSVAVVLPIVLLAACGGGLRSKEPVDQIYVLRAAAAGAGPAAVQGVLAVPRPQVQPGLDTDRVVLVRAGNELDHFAGSRWGESLPRVVAALAVQSLAGEGGFSSVVDAGRSAVASDYELLLTVRRFEADYTNAGVPVVQVAFECALTAGAPRRVLGRCDAAASEPAGENRMMAIIAAMERAAQRALTDMRSQAAAIAQREGR